MPPMSCRFGQIIEAPLAPTFGVVFQGSTALRVRQMEVGCGGVISGA